MREGVEVTGMIGAMLRKRSSKALLLLVAMCAVLTVSTAAASPSHHHTTVGGDCDLCCVGHLPALQSPHLSDIRPWVVLQWQPSAEEYQSSLDPQFHATLGRSPPV
jgi:hypothetical protein